MKTCLILAIGCSLEPWGKMLDTSQKTWDSIFVEGIDTIFYFGNPVKENTDKAIYFPIEESYAKMGEKMLQAFEWVLKNKTFDYIARVNSSCYVDKKELIKHIQALPGTDVFAGLEIKATETERRWMWGGGQFLMSRDAAEKIVENKHLWYHGEMEDKALSYIADDLKIPFTQGKALSIDRDGSNIAGWVAIVYGGGESFKFTDFADVKKLDNHFFYRVKQDNDRNMDAYVMQQLYNNLK